ncbi:MAG: rhodanese-like domain-containing protein [Candidatus Moranbacteria bacterium]|nr:rhodanese-like domain-containing protein [Candidatus Moranbacteria bacterium]
MMQEKARNNAIALSIGFFLIALITLATIFRPSPKIKSPDSGSAARQSDLIGKLDAAPKISNGELSKKIQRKEKMTLIDIRSEIEYAREHLLDSQNIPLAEINEALNILDKHATYVLIGADGISEPVATVLDDLSDNGFENMFYLEGGFSAWKDGYYPTISEGDPNRFTDQSKVNYIQTDALKELAGSGKNLLIIDVRKSDRFNEGHLDGSINIFLDDLEKRRKDIPFGKQIILCDDNGLGAFKAAVRLSDMGFYNVLTFSDGLDNWKKKGYPIVK